MKRILILLSLAALLAAPSFAGSLPCSTAMVTAGICRATTERVIFLSVAQAHIPTVVDALVDEAIQQGRWSVTVTCTQAMVNLSQCTAGQLGEQVANPVTKAQAADRQFRARLVNLVRSYLAESVHEAAEQVRTDGLAAIEDPDLGQ